jgi:hypothetical protein
METVVRARRHGERKDHWLEWPVKEAIHVAHKTLAPHCQCEHMAKVRIAVPNPDRVGSPASLKQLTEEEERLLAEAVAADLAARPPEQCPVLTGGVVDPPPPAPGELRG